MGEQGRQPEDFQLDSGWTVGEDEGESTETPRAIDDMTEEEATAALIAVTEKDERDEVAIDALRRRLRQEGKGDGEADLLVDRSPLVAERSANARRMIALNRRLTELSEGKK